MSSGKADRPAEDQQAATRQASGWARLARSGRPRLTKANVLGAVLTVALGFALQTQVTSNNKSGLENLRQDDLVALLDKVNQRATKLDGEVATLTKTRDALKSPGSDDEAVKQAEQRRVTLGILAGTVAAKGPGITLTITDPQHLVSTGSMVDAVEELRDAGAEAMQINDVRIVASTWIDVADDGTVSADGTKLTSPYVITAIGDPHTMSTAMAIPGGVEETIRGEGATVKVSTSQSLKVTALHRSSGGGYAQPEAATSTPAN